jgi:hypothetical protein
MLHGERRCHCHYGPSRSFSSSAAPGLMQGKRQRGGDDDLPGVRRWSADKLRQFEERVIMLGAGRAELAAQQVRSAVRSLAAERPAPAPGARAQGLVPSATVTSGRRQLARAR